MNNEISLETKHAGAITGDFYVPSYQRGYRWSKNEITRLLDDIYHNGPNNYCLQPIVVRNLGDRYELIDGQQRLTTLYIIFDFIGRIVSYYGKPAFTITYETRAQSKEYLENIDLSKRDDNIDFWFMANAWQCVNDWFNHQDKTAVYDVYGYLEKNVSVIWYEVGKEEDPIALFTRLNIGKIPLTNAELIKAMFLSRNAQNDSIERKEEISLQWDQIEKDLHDDRFWFFLTNDGSHQYQTRIDIILDLIADKPQDSREVYYSFYQFEEMKKEMSLDEIWRRIRQTYLLLKDWYEDHDFYHKIGYLIASHAMTLQEIYDFSLGKKKDEFLAGLDSFIKDSVRIGRNYAELSYEKNDDYNRISRLLLLFNVESVRLNGAGTQWFPFDKFKFNKNGKVGWSLEHIHAQQSQGLETQKLWKEWLDMHIPSVKAVAPDNTDLIQKMTDAVNNDKLSRNEFEDLQTQAVGVLSVEGNAEYMHSISNLALLNAGDNAALNNATFDVKRNKIIEMDKKGEYIPFCTRMVFLKYYTPSDQNQLHFWGQSDRIAYVSAMNTVLEPYLEEPIDIEKEDMPNE